MNEETRTCPVCGKRYGRTWYPGGWGPWAATCSRLCGQLFRYGDPAARFWSNVDQSGGPDACWPWKRRRLSQTVGRDYGVVGWAKKTELAHRVAYSLTHGEWPTGDVRHTCDNPPCCNGRHLIDGTTKDNIQDAVAKGRLPSHRGEGNPNATLTEAMVCDIRAMLADGLTQQSIADHFGVQQAAISDIKRGRTWAHVVCSPDLET